jgi:predicted protein tyrosine phosphatase
MTLIACLPQATPNSKVITTAQVVTLHKERLVAYIKNYPKIFFERMRKTTENVKQDE